MSSLSECLHNPISIKGRRFTGDDHGHTNVSICQNCGEISVSGMKNGQHVSETFGLVNEDLCLIAGRYCQLLEAPLTPSKWLPPPKLEDLHQEQRSTANYCLTWGVPLLAELVSLLLVHRKVDGRNGRAFHEMAFQLFEQRIINLLSIIEESKNDETT